MSYEELEGIGDTSVESLRGVWNSWSQDPIKAAILQAVLPYMTIHWLMGAALCQKKVFLHLLPMDERNSLLKCFQTSGGRGPLRILKELA